MVLPRTLLKSSRLAYVDRAVAGTITRTGRYLVDAAQRLGRRIRNGGEWRVRLRDQHFGVRERLERVAIDARSNQDPNEIDLADGTYGAPLKCVARGEPALEKNAAGIGIWDRCDRPVLPNVDEPAIGIRRIGIRLTERTVSDIRAA